MEGRAERGIKKKANMREKSEREGEKERVDKC